MTRRLQKPIPTDVIAAQRDAANPDTSAWVEANAGSGKTHVLTQRVLRLLLSGVKPEEVLCLTYTKAAAAEMRKRVSSHLAAWALMAEPALRTSLGDLIGGPPTAAQQMRARTLFAHALDTPGGLKVLTIHAFCESVLHRFPVEAGVPFDFAVLEDHERQSMILKARERVLAEGLRGGEHARAVELLFGHLSDFSIRESIDDALAKARPLRRVLEDREGAKRRLRQKVGFAGRTTAEIRDAIEHETLLLPGDCRALVEALGGDPLKTRGARFVDYLARGNLDHPSCDDLIEAFLTDAGTPRANLVAAKDRILHGDLAARFDIEGARIGKLAGEMIAARLVERSESLLDILSAIVEDYESAKRARSLLDFDDLIARAAGLFRDTAQGMWVRYKLDAGITHILVDESQDTNAEQWAVVKLLAEEFFVGMSAVERQRTIFAVGDGKQSIFSFQGADPELFAASGNEFEVRSHEVRARFARVPLETSFRSLPNILGAVDIVFADEERRLAVLAREAVRHRTARAEAGGTVTLWPPIKTSSEAPPPSDGWPLEPADSMASGPRRVAQRIAREIRGWIDTRRPLGPRGRPVRPEDILILVQTRSSLFHELIRSLVSEGLPTPGADRLMVTTHIAILDLMALGDVLLNTADDLQLAAVLRSPLFDLGEDELYAVAHGRKGSLWHALREAPAGKARDAHEQLHAWRRALDFERPYEFFAEILYRSGGLRRFHERFGSEVDDLFAEFLDLAFEHEQDENPSLQGFLATMRSREITITRELSGAVRGVRVMTVHGAKGLEAPIVILADAASKPSGRQLAKPVIIDAKEGLFLHASRKDDHVPATLPLREQEEKAQWREYWRKLYVGMTRAEDELYVTGFLTKIGRAEGSWYAAIESALAPESEVIGEGEDATLIYPRERPRIEPVKAGTGTDATLAPLTLDPLPARPVREIVRPSLATGKAARLDRVYDTAAAAAYDAETARKRGIALHALLQHLPRLARADWETVTADALAAIAADIADQHAGLTAKALSILNRPELAEVFGPESRAEVPFLAPARRKGTPIMIAGRVDRLVVTPDRVLIVDFKSDAAPPRTAEGVPAAYVTQLGLYAMVARQLFPGRAVTGAILWTELESLMELDPPRLASAVEGFTLG